VKKGWDGGEEMRRGGKWVRWMTRGIIRSMWGEKRSIDRNRSRFQIENEEGLGWKCEL
jgi:hypothetical protein